WYLNPGKSYDEWVYDDLARTLEKLKSGQSILCPATGKHLYPTNYILFDAPLGYCHQATGKYIDFLVCLDTPLDIALARRLIRDYQEQPDCEKMVAELNYYLSSSRPLFVLTQEEKQCDLLLDGSLPVDDQCQKVLNAVTCRQMKGKVTLRPTQNSDGETIAT